MANSFKATHIKRDKDINIDTPKPPSEELGRDDSKRALDELFNQTTQYRTSKAYHALLQFVARFRFYSPFNAMLVHMQMPGAVFVATPHRWLKEFGRTLKPDARPLVMLKPMGPVMFVFDVCDTDPTEYSRPLPPDVENPFSIRRGCFGNQLEQVMENAIRDGLRVTFAKSGSQSAGSIRLNPEAGARSQNFTSGYDKNRQPIVEPVPIRYDLVVSDSLAPEGRYATIVHELAHLYCGHLGSPNGKWWPNRQGLSRKLAEFEAESVAYLVCSRLGIENPSEKYLSSFVKTQDDVPRISLDCVLKATGLIESMSSRRMKLRKT